MKRFNRSSDLSDNQNKDEKLPSRSDAPGHAVREWASDPPLRVAYAGVRAPAGGEHVPSARHRGDSRAFPVDPPVA